MSQKFISKYYLHYYKLIECYFYKWLTRRQPVPFRPPVIIICYGLNLLNASYSYISYTLTLINSDYNQCEIVPIVHIICCVCMFLDTYILIYA